MQHSPMQMTSATARIGGKAFEDESMLRPESQREWTRINTHGRERWRVTRSLWNVHAGPKVGLTVPTGRGGTERRWPARETKNERKKALRARWPARRSLVTPRIRGPHPLLTPRINLDPLLDMDLGREQFSSSSKISLNNIAFANDWRGTSALIFLLLLAPLSIPPLYTPRD